MRILNAKYIKNSLFVLNSLETIEDAFILQRTKQILTYEAAIPEV